MVVRGHDDRPLPDQGFQSGSGPLDFGRRVGAVVEDEAVAEIGSGGEVTLMNGDERQKRQSVEIAREGPDHTTVAAQNGAISASKTEAATCPIDWPSHWGEK